MSDDARSRKAGPKAPAGIGAWIGTLFAHGLFALLGSMGLFMLYAGLRVLVTGEREWGTGPRVVVSGDAWGVAVLSAALGFIFAAIGVGYFYYVCAGGRRRRRRARARDRDAVV
jgi:hypothetical protein